MPDKKEWSKVFMAEHLPVLDVFGKTDVGLKRTRNEDTFEIIVPPHGSPQEQRGALFIVADGMGGIGGGDVASKAAVEEIIRQFYGETAADLVQRISAAIESANRFVRDQARVVGLPRIGSTAAGLALMPQGEAVIFNVGDSRVYRVRGSSIEQISRDQSVLANQIELGLVSEASARQARNVNVTAFIGQPRPLEAVCKPVQPQPDDVFIICSDGLWDLVQSDEMVKIVGRLPAARAAHQLIELARKRGAHDNVTAVIVRLGHPPHSSIPLLIAAALVGIGLIGGAVLLNLLR